MVSVILLILKIIGFALLALLGLLLLCLLILLFSPFKYRAFARGVYGSEKKEYEARVRASWLFHLVSLKAEASEQELRGRLRVLGMTLWQAGEPERPVKKKKKKRSRLKNSRPSAKEPARKPEPVKEEARPGAEEERKRAEEPLIIQEAGEKRARPGLSELLKRAAKKLFYAARAFCGKIKGILKNGRPFLDFLNDAENREAFSFLLSEGKRLLLRVLPRKLSGTVRFDLEDPASVGKALIFLSFLYPAIGDRVQITPLFENENRLEGELSLEGRIRAVSLLIIGIRVFFDQRVRKLLRRGQKLRRGAGRSL